MQRSLPRDPSCGALARRLVEEQLAGRASPTALADAKTVVSELVNNAYVHGSGEIELELVLREDTLRIEVVDQGQGVALGIRREARASGGHGLHLVQTLACDWGAFEGTTHVWAELDLGSQPDG